jgi:hypothetical protein
MNLGAAMAVVGGGENFHSYISGSLEQLKKRRLNDSRHATTVAMSPLPTHLGAPSHLPQSPAVSAAQASASSPVYAPHVIEHFSGPGADAHAHWSGHGGGAAAMLTPKQQKNVGSQVQTPKGVSEAQLEQIPEMVAAPPPQGEEQVFPCVPVSVLVPTSVRVSVSVSVCMCLKM